MTRIATETQCRWVADEVQTGFGRTGSNYWGFENQARTPPVMMLVGPGITLNPKP